MFLQWRSLSVLLSFGAIDVLARRTGAPTPTEFMSTLSNRVDRDGDLQMDGWAGRLNSLREQQLDALNPYVDPWEEEVVRAFGVGAAALAAVHPVVLRKWVQSVGPAALKEEMGAFRSSLKRDPDTLLYPSAEMNELRLQKLKQVAGKLFWFTESSFWHGDFDVKLGPRWTNRIVSSRTGLHTHTPRLSETRHKTIPAYLPIRM